MVPLVTDLLVELPPISAGPLMPFVHGGPVEDVSVRRAANGRRRAVSAVVVLLGVLVLGHLRAQILGGLRSLAALDAPAALAVLGCLVLMLIARAVVNHLSHPGSNLRQGFVLDQIFLAANNGLPGGMVVGSAARYRISRSFGHSPELSALGAFAIGQAFSLGRWMLVLIVILHQAVVGSVGTTEVMVLISALVSITIGALVWRAVVTDSVAILRLSDLIQRALDRFGLRWRRLRNRDVATFMDSIRRSASMMTGTRASLMLLAGALSTLAGAAVILVVVTCLEQSVVGPDAWTLLRVYLLARVATSFIPTPGALAALDAALVGGLMAAGVDAPTAVAAVLVYRAVTFVLPILTGGLMFIGWRRWVAVARTQSVSEPA